MRGLFLFLMVLLGVWLLRRLFGNSDGDHDTPDPGRLREEPRSELMRECRHCGVLVPESEGTLVGEDFFCCAGHARDYASGDKA